MIVFDLICGGEHRFEGWFSSNDDLLRQREQGILSCPLCGDTKVAKLPGAKIKRGEESRPPGDGRDQPVSAGEQATVTTDGTMLERQSQLAEFIAHVVKNSENVGTRFAEEARKIHYQEAPERAIRGHASREETRELLEEGIAVLPLPMPPQSDMH